MLFYVSAVPTPSVTISTPPGNLVAATEASLILTCNVDFDSSLASYVDVSLTWIRGSSFLSNSIDQVSISSSLLGSYFTSNLTLYPLEDSANFTCRAGIIPSDNLTSFIASDISEDAVEVAVEGELW